MNSKIPIACLAAIASIASVQGVSVTHLEDSVVRTWFSVNWGPDPTAPLAFIKNGPLSDAGSVDHDTFVHVDAIHPFFSDSFDINFAAGSRLFSTATVVGFEGVQLIALPGDDYGVQVVYGEPVPVNGQVPDASGTAGLLCLASGLIFWIGRRAAPAAT